MASLKGCIIIGPDGHRYQLVEADNFRILEGIHGLKGATLGSRIRDLREAKGLSQRSLASSAGMTQAQLSRIENGLVEQPHRSILVNLMSLIAA